MSTDSELERRLQALEDREAIRNLLQEYRRTLDLRDMRAFSELYAVDGTWTGASGSATGPEAIYEMLVGVLPDNPPAPAATLWHWISDPAITVAGDRGTASSFWMHVRRGEGDTPLLPTLGHYQDDLVRESGRWRFQLRRVTRLIPEDPSNQGKIL
ncbi:MAG: nuclear transport factor 2 family protein [Gaiellales bacterium]